MRVYMCMTAVWYLLGVCQHRMGPEHYEAALASAERGLQLIGDDDDDEDEEEEGDGAAAMREMLVMLRDGLAREVKLREKR